jgi:hypothetical protein
MPPMRLLRLVALPAVLLGVTVQAQVAVAADCAPGALPPGAQVVSDADQVLVWKVVQDPAAQPQDLRTAFSACAKPAGAPVELVTETIRVPVEGLTTAGTRVAFVAGDVHAFRYATVVDTATGDRSLRRDLTAPVLRADGAVAGTGLYRRSLQVFSAAAAAPTVVDLAGTARDVVFAGDELTFRQSGKAFSVDTTAPALAGPPRKITACKALTPFQAKAAGGSGKGTDFAVDPPYAERARQCTWKALKLTVDPAMSASQRRALLGSAAAAGLRRVTVAGAVAFDVFSGAGEVPVRRLSVLRSGTLVTLELRGAGARTGGARLRAAAVRALRAEGFR